MNTVSSEVDRLKKVIVHRPDDGIEVITPDNALKFLYDDIVYLPLMQKEHDTFTKVLEHFVGEKNVLDTYNLLVDNILENKNNNTKKLIDYVVDLENCTDEVCEILYNLKGEELAYTLFTGIYRKTGELILRPLPNYVFTRDIGVVINDYVLICNASKKARTRESILTRYIIYFHPEFKHFQANNDAKIIDMTRKCDDCTIEGGDVMMLGNTHLLVGCSERSTPEAFESLKEEVFRKNVIENLVRIVIAKDRSSMHIDTLFTQISENEYVIYEDTLKSDIIKITLYTKNGGRKEFSTLEEFFLDYNPNMKFILCGDGDETFAAREQWTDGCNLVAVKNGVAISYFRNTRTAKALEKAGYKIVHADEFLKELPNPDSVEKTIVAISSTELSRARGGPHCMTFPIWRG
ncbi:MAG: arginine deiminase [Bacteroidetes bacterium]|nr:arginine deiminase [Bacteroidota bacterium]MCB9225624.1 arginine deiminase [Chitinophagales bacterium]